MMSSSIDITKEPPPASSKQKKTNKSRVITPAGKLALSSLDKRMTVEKDIVDELLLVCGVIGSSSSSSSSSGGNNNNKTNSTTIDNGGDEEELVPVTDCLNWLQDLQRALRRDEDLYRPISLLIGKWRVVEQKLLPLVMSCRHDTPMVLTIVKILVILTKPLSENTKRAGRLVIDTKSKKAPSKDIIAQQLKLKDNAKAQADLLLEYKRIICHHPSHHHNHRKKKNNSTTNKGLLSIFVSLLAEPLSKAGASRTDTDHLTIELVLHLFRNLLAAEPLVNTSPEVNREHNHIHHMLIDIFGKEMVLEIILVLGQELELRENAQYNLLMMELLNNLFKNQDPTTVARSSSSSNKLFDSVNNKQNINGNDSGGGSSDNTTNNNPKKKNATTSLLSQRLQAEKSSRQTFAGNRHAHFGGTWMQEQQSTGKRSYVGVSSSSTTTNTMMSSSSSSSAKRRNKKTEPFVASSTSLQIYSRRPPALDGPATSRAHKTINTFCKRFIKDCYGPVMKSLKNEFRRDSARLEDDDMVVFFRIIWFLNQWWRNSPTNEKHDGCLGQLVFTMDVFTFTLVLNATDHFYQHKQYDRLAQTVALYSEQLHLMNIMRTSTDDTEHIMTLGLMERLFLNSDPLDRLPKLIGRWTPATMTREYVCDLAEVCHTSLKLLDEHTAMCRKDLEGKDDKQLKDNVDRVKANAAEFDVKSYFCKKIVSNQLIWMYTQLLGQYKVNSPLVQHRIIAMFMRISNTEIALPDAVDVDTPINPLGMKRVTLQPMLYSLPLFLVLEQVLNDTTARSDKSNDVLIAYATNHMYNFWKATHDNPLLYVECLFRHSTPHRFCELATNSYVNDELRMLAEKDLLLQDQRYDDVDLEQGRNSDDDDDDDEELVFENGDVSGSNGRKTTCRGAKSSVRKRKGKSNEDDSDDDDGEDEDKTMKESRVNNSDDDSDEEDEDEANPATQENVGENKEGSTNRGKKVESSDSSDEDSLRNEVTLKKREAEPRETEEPSKKKMRSEMKNNDDEDDDGSSDEEEFE